MTPPQETFFYPLNGSERGSHPSLTTRDRKLVSVLEVRIELGDLNPRPLTPQSVTLPIFFNNNNNNYVISLYLNPDLGDRNFD